MADVALVLHGHFYQPPRENPWTEVVPRQPTAAPFHDWNERITAECYRPNGWARILGDHGRIVAIVDNYRRLSFDMGPTLLSWLEDHAPATYDRIVAAERVARRAIAQGYGHAILPLCNDRDLRTQVRWGLADFRHRFGREAEGLWLPETAVDDRVLATLAEEGVAFTILAPNQIAAVRDPDTRWLGPGRGRRPPCRGPCGGATPTGPTSVSTSSSTTARSPTTWPSAGSAARSSSTGSSSGRAATSCRWPATASRSATTTPTPTAASPTRWPSSPAAAASTCPAWPTGWRSTRPPARAGSTCRPGRAPTASAGGWRTAAATPAASPAGTRRGGPRCGPRSTRCATGRSRCSSGAAPPCCATRGPRGTPTSTWCWGRRRSRRSPPPTSWTPATRTPSWVRSRCWRASGTPCSCTRRAAGSSTTWPASRPCRSCGTRPAAATCWPSWASPRRSSRCWPRWPRPAATTPPRATAARSGDATSTPAASTPAGSRPTWP